ncbi:hypothetical protein [Agrobacterium tumefaciens]|uniref:hypothetical protein n=1 Tax=Agrobacterium tumefaciens TaxID=358 RepID=UPI003B9E6AC2
MPFSLSVQAEEDIISIAEEGIRIFGALVAGQYHDELFALLELIATNPLTTETLTRRYPAR